MTMPISSRKVNEKPRHARTKISSIFLEKQPFRVDITPNLLYYITVIKR